VNDPKNPKNPPPDDFSKTTPYIRNPQQDSAPEQSSDYTSDWEKTNYIYSSPRKETPKSGDDEWGKTAANINLPRQNQAQDFDKTFMPGQQASSPPQSDWDAAPANFNINQNDFGDAPRRENDFGATMPFVQLPESERAKLRGQQPPPEEPQFTPNQPPEQTVESKKSGGGVPPWAWFAGVAGLFLLLAATMIISYMLFSKRYGYDVVVKGAEPHSETFVDGTRWGYTTGNGDVLLAGLRAAEHKIEIKHPNFTYETETVSGSDGDATKEVVVRKKPKAATVTPPTDDCANIKKGDFAKASKCANDALDKLGDQFSVEELLRAMNLYIINFDSGKFDIKPNDMQFLTKAAGYMKKLPPNVKIEVGGHTDNVGNAASNQKLSENRASAVRNALVGLGVSEAMLEMRGYGATRPKPGNTNANEDEKFQNRRIEYTAIIR
jgi:outer membrane protein OmpA-like peptidoglycan-associated protein